MAKAPRSTAWGSYCVWSHACTRVLITNASVALCISVQPVCSSHIQAFLYGLEQGECASLRACTPSVYGQVCMLGIVFARGVSMQSLFWG